MKKKIICGYWFYTVGFLILLLLHIGVTSFIISLDIIYPEEYLQSQLGASIVLVLMLVPGSVYLIIVGGNLIIQFTVFSEKGIKVRAPFCTIRSLDWSEVKEVRYEKLYVSVPGGFTKGWYVFDDGIERKQGSGLVSKKSHIVVPATKRTKKIIETFWHEPIIEKQIEK